MSTSNRWIKHIKAKPKLSKISLLFEVLLISYIFSQKLYSKVNLANTITYLIHTLDKLFGLMFTS